MSWFAVALEKMPKGCVHVMYNAPYQSRREQAVPKTVSRKEVI